MDGDFDDIDRSSIVMERDEEPVNMNSDTFG